MTLAEMFTRGRVGVSDGGDEVRFKFRRGVKIPKGLVQSPTAIRELFTTRGIMTREQAEQFCPDSMAETLNFILTHGANVGAPNRGPKGCSIETQA